MFNLKKQKIKMKIFFGLYLVFVVLTFVGAISCIVGKVINAGYAIIPMTFSLIFSSLYRNSKKAIEENTKR